MKVRIKFSKEGPVRFVGHLDTMRYFQKAVRRADLPAAFSQGYSPHMIMSFASPLGVGVESEGEYFDLELREDMSTEEIRKRLDREMAEGVHVVGAARVEDGKGGNAMSLVAAADYRVTFRKGSEPCPDWAEKVKDFLDQKEILITKKTKKGEQQVDIRPFIYSMKTEEGHIFYRLASASANYTRADTVTDAFIRFLLYPESGRDAGTSGSGITIPPYTYQIRRLEVYADKGTEEKHEFVPLLDLGEAYA